MHVPHAHDTQLSLQRAQAFNFASEYMKFMVILYTAIVTHHAALQTGGRLTACMSCRHVPVCTQDTSCMAVLKTQSILEEGCFGSMDWGSTHEYQYDI